MGKLTDAVRNILKLKQVAQEQFHIPVLYPEQDQVFSELLKNHSGLAVIPTGGGKSLLYQLWSATGDGLTLVLSPLIALMQDQVLQAKAQGLDAYEIHSGLTSERRESVMAALRSGRGQILVCDARAVPKT